jgi:multiple antibiotic resistance protein
VVRTPLLIIPRRKYPKRGRKLKMETILLHAVTVFMGFFAIMNPIANIPIFLSLTREEDKQTKRSIASTSLILAFLIVVVFSFTGKVIFELFGITLPAFRITGGLLVFLIGFHMLQGDFSRVNHPSEKDKQDSKAAALSVSISPLAIPILAGPGTITTAMNFSAGGFVNMGVTIGVFAILCAITYVCFVFGEKFVAFIGASALGAITRMMGLILAVIGTQMVLDGLHGAFELTSLIDVMNL